MSRNDIILTAGCIVALPSIFILALVIAFCDTPNDETIKLSISGAVSENKMKLDAEGEPFKGGVMPNSKLFEAKNDSIVVYRAYDASKPWTKHGRWWSFERPSGNKKSYRIKNAICPTWNSIDRIVKCNIKPEADFIVGYTQSAKCDDDVIYKSQKILQVYIPNTKEDLDVINCVDLGEWK